MNVRNTIGTLKVSELQQLNGLVDFVDLVKQINQATLPPLRSHLSPDALGNLTEQAYYSSELAEEGRYPLYQLVAYARSDDADQLRTAFEFEPPLPLNSQSLRKIAPVAAAGGTTVRKEPQDLTIEEWDQVLDVNLRSAFLASREVYPHMKAQGGGKIINIGSMFSLFGGGGSGAPYSSSKGGVVQLAKSLAVAWAKDNIQSNAILPGWFMTELTAAIPANQPDRYDLISRRIPTGRWGEPEELQGAVVFLASPASDYVTGAVLTVDGGYSVM